MNIKTAALGLIVSAVCVAPVLAHAGHGGQSHGNGGNAHGAVTGVLGTGVVCDDDNFLEQGGFARWTNNHGYQFTFGGTWHTTGLRIEASPQKARSFQLDWDLTDADDPYFLIFVDDITDGLQFEYEYVFNLDPSVFTETELSNGFTRIFYDAIADGVESNWKFNNIYAFDFNPPLDGSETIRNVLVNKHAIVPNVNSSIPQIDCTMNYFDE